MNRKRQNFQVKQISHAKEQNLHILKKNLILLGAEFKQQKTISPDYYYYYYYYNY